MKRLLFCFLLESVKSDCSNVATIGEYLNVTYTVVSNTEVAGKFLFNVELVNNGPVPVELTESSKWEIHFTHVYGIEDFVAALDGIELVDFYTSKKVGLDLFRYGGFYWKFILNQDWKSLAQGN